ncbi:MAG: hypothetical protein OXN18_07755 [Gemmatimonadota bacterium]|nr:hypothetical protein [Gemmatimonadota bacterium]
MLRTSHFLTVAALSATAVSCGDTASDTPDAGGYAEPGTTPSPVTTVDSAGVEIIRISDVHMLDVPEVELRLLHSTAAIPDLFFESVIAAAFLPDSSLVIADSRLFELTFLDPGGTVRARSGQAGEGPGEYLDITRIAVGPDGAPFVFDWRQRRLTFLDAQGTVTDIVRLEQGAGLGAAVPLSRLRSGEVVAALETRPTLPPGIQRGPVFLVLANDAGEIADTLGQWAGKERHVGDDWNPVGFGLTALFAGRGEHALVGTNDSLNLTLYRGATPVTRIRGGYSARMVTAAEKEEWTETFLGVLPEQVHASWRRRLEQSTVRDTYPAYGAISVDANGRIWIGDYPKLADQTRRWTILEADGTPVGTLSLPVLRPIWLEDTVAVTGQPHEVLDVAHGRIAVLRRDELGVEFVEVYEMAGAPGA